MSKFPTKQEKIVKKSKKELPPDIFGELLKDYFYTQGLIVELVDCTPDKAAL